MMDTKQVLVVRADLKMRRGKECAQCGHAAIAWLACRLKGVMRDNHWFLKSEVDISDFTPIEQEWLSGLNKKVCLSVDSEEELLAIAESAKQAGILCYVIKDEGLTEFGGVPTNTCLALGPDLSEKIDKITGHLKLR